MAMLCNLYLPWGSNRTTILICFPKLFERVELIAKGSVVGPYLLLLLIAFPLLQRGLTKLQAISCLSSKCVYFKSLNVLFWWTTLNNNRSVHHRAECTQKSLQDLPIDRFGKRRRHLGLQQPLSHTGTGVTTNFDINFTNTNSKLHYVHWKVNPTYRGFSVKNPH